MLICFCKRKRNIAVVNNNVVVVFPLANVVAIVAVPVKIKL